VHADHTGLQAGLSFEAVRQFFEESGAEEESHTGILPHLGNAVFGGDGRHFQDGMTADGAARATVSPDGMIPGVVAQEKGGYIGPVGNPVHVPGVATPRVHPMGCRAPAPAPRGVPPRRRIVMLRPGLGRVGNDMLVIAADDGKMVLDEPFPILFFAGDPDAPRAPNADGLEVLGPQYGSDAAGGVGTVINHDGHGHEVLSRRADGGHHRVRSHDFGDGCRRRADSLPPDPAGSVDLDLLIYDHEPYGTGRLSLNDDGVVARILELRGKLTAHMSRGHQGDGPAERPEGRDGRTAAAWSSRARQGSHGKDNPVFRIIGHRSRRDFIPHHLVADPRATQIILVTRNGILRPDPARGQIDPQNLACPTSIYSHRCFLFTAALGSFYLKMRVYILDGIVKNHFSLPLQGGGQEGDGSRIL